MSKISSVELMVEELDLEVRCSPPNCALLSHERRRSLDVATTQAHIVPIALSIRPRFTPDIVCQYALGSTKL